MADSTAPPRQLNHRQEAFVFAYIGESRYNATRAALSAGYSPKTAYAQGHDLLKVPEIAARIREELSTRAMSAEAVLTELTDVATAEWRDFVTVRTDPKTGETLDVKMDLSNKVKSLEILAKAHGLLTDKLDISGTLTAQVELVGVDPGDI